MSFDIAPRLARGAAITAVLTFAALLSACQVRPLYSETSGVAGKLASVGFSDATTRVEQEVRNRLIFLATRGAGEPVKPAYEVELHVRSDVVDALLVESSDESRAGRVTVSVDYTLQATADGQVIKSGNRYVTALVDFPIQQFAKQRAIRDAENRAAREAAELVGLDIAGALGR
ncbi:lipopolysccharide assembly LptE family protein [Rhizobium gallicum]|uniref:Lipopolysccharide assembly LptE family protein n=1 Tax=Rhizobium gallicum TaxID=56730 RepID=A0A1L5NPD3_9HYPH|nr:LPS assembly lipoprotein LptE [Rhizobium gallicum]APO69742.1 lipopolysccharide assembly LptE family protein [Rhizobium gallicum]